MPASRLLPSERPDTRETSSTVTTRTASRPGLRGIAGGIPVTMVLILVNLGLYGVTAVQAGSVMRNGSAPLFEQSSLVPLFVAFFDQWHRLLTSAFMHFGLIHLLLNMLILWMLGNGVERSVGPLRFAVIYLVSALGGSAAVMWFSQTSSTAGASGAIFGLMGAYAVLALVLKARVQGILSLIGLNVIVTLVVPGVSMAGHFGGLAAGALVTLALIVLPRKLPASVGRTPRIVMSWLLAAAVAVACVVASYLAVGGIIDELGL